MTLSRALEIAGGLHLLAAFAEARAAANHGEEAEKHRIRAEHLRDEAYRIVREST